MQRIIAEKEPPKPSTRLSTMHDEERMVVAKNRRIDVKALSKVCHGDLDWIVMKALEKDRTHRYQTANGVLADIRRHLDNEPISVAAPTFRYQWSKFARRNRRYMRFAASVATLLFLALVFSSYQAVRSTRAHGNAEAARQQAQKSYAQARDAQASEAQLRRQADEQARTARQRAYNSDLNLAERALEMNDLNRVRRLLDRQVPAKGETDLRNWEWRHLWSQTRPDNQQVLVPAGAGYSDQAAFSRDGRLLAYYGSATAVMDLVSRERIFYQRSDPGIALAHRAPLLAYAENHATSNLLKIFDLTAKKELIQQNRTGHAARSQAFTPDDKVLITVYSENRERSLVEPGQPPVARAGELDETRGLLTATDVATGTLLWQQQIDLFSGRVRMDISPDGQTVAVPVDANPNLREKAGVKLFDIAHGKERLKIETAIDPVRAVRFSPDGLALLTSATYLDGAIRIWNAHDGHFLGLLVGHQSYVTDLAFTPDGHTLISASGDLTIRTWDWAERRSAGVLRGHLHEVNGLAVSPDGKTLASSCEDGSIYLWDLARIHKHTGLRTVNLSPPSRFNLNAVQKTKYTFTPQGDSIVAKPFRGRPVIWHTSSLESSESPADTGSARGVLAVSPDGEKVVTSNGDPFDSLLTQETYRVLHVPTGREIASFSVSLPQSPDGKPMKRGRWMAFTGDGKWLVLCQRLRRSIDSANSGVDAPSANLLLEIWDTDTWRHRHFEHTVRAGEDWDVRKWGKISAPDYSATLEALPLPNVVAMVEWSMINILDLAQPERGPRTIQLQDGMLPFAAFAASPDGSTAAAVSQDGGVLMIWDWKTLEPRRQFQAMKVGAYSLAYSPDGRRLAIGGSDDEAVKVYDTGTWDELLTLKGDAVRFEPVMFSPDGRFLLGVSNGKGYLWSAPSLEESTASQGMHSSHTGAL
jgi:eukaryotic-like serine/threonine-protein kinase